MVVFRLVASGLEKPLKSTFSKSWLLVAVLLMSTAIGCTAGGDETRRASGINESVAAAEVTMEATTFGGIQLGPEDTVLNVQMESALDTRYALAIETDPAGLDALLEHSLFAAPLIPTSAPFVAVVAGPDLASSPSVLKAQDRFVTSDNNSVTRNVVVDERDDRTRFVHIELFTT